MIDHTDKEILRLLSRNSRLQWREIGEQVHLSGPAVAQRVRRMEQQGVIRNYTVYTDRMKTGFPIRAYINVYMSSSDHLAFHEYVRNDEAVERVERVSGDSCYLMTVQAQDEGHLNRILKNVLRYGNYKITLAIGDIK